MSGDLLNDAIDPRPDLDALHAKADAAHDAWVAWSRACPRTRGQGAVATEVWTAWREEEYRLLDARMKARCAVIGAERLDALAGTEGP